MIYINLLPKEFRGRERMPLKSVLLVAGGVGTACTLGAFAAWLWFGELAAARSDRELAQETLDSLQPQLAHVKALEAERKGFESRASTLDEIAQNRVGWTAKLDQMIDVINTGGSGQKYLIWLDDLTVSRQFDKKTKTAGLYKAQANCGGENIGLVANFLDDLQGSEFYAGFEPPKPPEGKRRDDGDGLIPSSAWNFDLELRLKARETEADRPAKASKNSKSSKAGAKKPAKDASAVEGEDQ
jgi:Tfp pilus assembly protein PilN